MTGDRLNVIAPRMVLEQICDQVVTELERKFYPESDLKSKEMSRGYFKMAVLYPLAQSAVLGIIHQLLQKNTRMVVLSEVLSKNEKIKNGDSFLKKLSATLRTNEKDTASIFKIAVDVLLMSDVFKKPRKFIAGEKEITVILLK
ncbi:MAG: hypothetical protein UX07_C0031G0004 [Parcubacteria group bacterium GW2011_GWA2_45_30]|nr:MAG: hypothetical protein UX07_C0031G0004 [Parcubacteria group bacterium GW2011_GWA2_45_30]